MRREKDETLRAERQSILFALLAAVSSCVVAYGRPLPSSSATLRSDVVKMRVLKDAGDGSTGAIAAATPRERQWR